MQFINQPCCLNDVILIWKTVAVTAKLETLTILQYYKVADCGNSTESQVVAILRDNRLQLCASQITAVLQSCSL